VTYGRHNPFPAKLLACEPLNKPGSMKDTRFVALDLKGSGLTYRVGDALGVFPENDPDTVAWVLDALDATGAEEVLAPDGPKISLYEALHKHYSLGKPTDLMFELLINSAVEPAEASALKSILAEDRCPDGDEVLDLLKQFPSARPSVEEFVSALNPLQPRLYSISSSLKAHPDQVHLTVGVVRYMNSRGRQCKGACSTFFADRVRPGQQARVFVHASHGFGVPANGNVPMIMVGPGTGIAPFRAFLEERKAAGATGKNWLFFGDQQRAFDYLYEQELTAWQQEGFLTRLDLAFSRDQQQKVYVQNRMLENAAEIWKWLQQGAHFYVCGDAKRMATDVDNALKQIVAEQGAMTPDAAKAYVADMTKAKRYQRDVY
jgi:sulfite reductase (NADPH) flavoprotein alpha-component